MTKLSPTQVTTGSTKDLWRLGILPIMAVGAFSGLFGIYWDISWHIDKGRDTFFSPPHNLIYLSMGIVLVVTLLGFFRDRQASRFHLRLGRAHLHPGLVITALGTLLVLVFAPADELWHRWFGTDLTLWAPMHLIGVLGLNMLSFGGLVGTWVDRRLTTDPGRQKLLGFVSIFFAATLIGWYGVLLAEYEFVVPAFPTFWHPLLLTGLPVFVLVLIARLNPVPFAATLAATGFTLIRLLLAGWLMISSSVNLAGHSKPAIPFLLLAGIAADLLVKRSPLWLSGLVIGLTCFVTNYLLTLISSVNWHQGALVFGLPSGLVLAVMAAYSGSWVAESLKPKTTVDDA
ncbi:MAG: hypothetical protein CMO31_01905 [Trueperaceae bacterium]|nr:hypothetical protein [Trueperaceae bacterium]MCH2667047.1 hypothetical protein [Deinococcales bacterium]